MTRTVRKIRRSVKRELGRHDWASARTPSGQHLRRKFARRMLSKLSSHDRRTVLEACVYWDYVKRYICKEEADWGLVPYFILAPLTAEDFESAEHEIVTAMSRIASEELAAIEDASIFEALSV